MMFVLKLASTTICSYFTVQADFALQGRGRSACHKMHQNAVRGGKDTAQQWHVKISFPASNDHDLANCPMLNALQLNWRWNGMIHKSMSAQVGYVMSHMISFAGKLSNIHMLNMFEASSTCKQATPICFAVSLKWKRLLLAITGCKCWNVHQHHPTKSCRTKLSTSLTSPMQSWNHWPWPESHHAIPAWCDSAFCSSSQYPWDIQRYPNRVSHSLLTKSLYIVDPPVLQTVNSIII